MRVISTPSGFIPDWAGFCNDALVYIFAERGSLCACGHPYHYHADCPYTLRPSFGGLVFRDYAVQSTGCCTTDDCNCSEFVDIRTVEKYLPWLTEMKIPFLGTCTSGQ